MQNKQLIIAVVAFVVLAVGAYMTMTDTTRVDTTPDPPALPELTVSAITELEIENPQEERTIVLTRSSDAWEVGAEGDDAVYPVDANMIKTALDRIAKLQLADIVGTDSVNYPSYELGDDEAVIVTASGADGVKRKVLLGKNAPGFNATFLRLPDRTEIFKSTEVLRSTYDREISVWRDKVMSKVDREKVARVTIENGSEPFSFVPKPQEETEAGEGAAPSPSMKEYALEGAPDTPLKQSDVRSLVNATLNLRAADYAAPDVVPAEAGLEPPAATVTVEAEGAEPVTVRIGDPVPVDSGEPSQYYAMVEGRPWVYLLAKYNAERFLKPLSELTEAPQNTDTGKVAE